MQAPPAAHPLPFGQPLARPAGTKRRQGTQRTYRPWTTAETVALQKLVTRYGCDTKHWGTIAVQMPGRSSKQCRDRWMNFAAEGINTDKWSGEEDLLIAAHHAQHGSTWARLSKELNGRTQLAIKNRWHSTLRARFPHASRTALHIYINALKAGKSAYDAYAEAYKFVTGSDTPDLDLSPLVKCEPLDDTADPTTDDGSLSALQGSAPTMPDEPASPDGAEYTDHNEATSRTASPLPYEAGAGYTQQHPTHLPHPPSAASATSPSSLSPSPPICCHHPLAELTDIPSISSLDASASSHFSTHPLAPTPAHPPSFSSIPVSAGPPCDAPPADHPQLRRPDPPPTDYKRRRLTCSPATAGPQPSALSHSTRPPAPSPRTSPFVHGPPPRHPNPSRPHLSPYVSTTPLLAPRHHAAPPHAEPCPQHAAPPPQQPLRTAAPPPHPTRTVTIPPQPTRAATLPPHPAHPATSPPASHHHQHPPQELPPPADLHALKHELALLYSRAGPRTYDPFSALSQNAIVALAELDTRAPLGSASHWRIPHPSTASLSAKPGAAPYPHPHLVSPSLHPDNAPAANLPAPHASLPYPPEQRPSAPRLPSPFEAYAGCPYPPQAIPPRASLPPAEGPIRAPAPALAARLSSTSTASNAGPPARPPAAAPPAIRSAVTLRPTNAELHQLRPTNAEQLRLHWLRLQRHRQLLQWQQQYHLQQQQLLLQWRQQQQQPQQPPRRHSNLATGLFGLQQQHQQPTGSHPHWGAAAAGAASAADPTVAAGAAGDAQGALATASSGDLLQVLSAAGGFELAALASDVEHLSDAEVQELMGSCWDGQLCS